MTNTGLEKLAKLRIQTDHGLRLEGEAYRAKLDSVKKMTVTRRLEGGNTI